MGTPQTSVKKSLIFGHVRTLIQIPEEIIVGYDNLPYCDKDNNEVEQPKVGSTIGDDAYFLNVVIDDGSAFQAEMGGNGRFRNPGILFIEHFTSPRSGTAKADDFEDLLKSTFRSVVRDGIMYRTPIRNRAGRIDDGTWWRTTFSIPFHYDD